MKTLLLAGGILLLLLGLLLLVAAVIAFVVARNKSAKAAGPQPQPRPGQAPPPRPQAPVPPPGVAPAAHPAAPPQAPPPPPPPAPVVTVPIPDTDATVVAMKLGLGALHGLTGLVKGQTFPLLTDGFYIGRDHTLSQVVVEDPSVSKRHLWVGVRDGVVMAVDQSSTNGTYLNTLGTRIGEVRLSPGDTIIISDDVARLVYKV